MFILSFIGLPLASVKLTVTPTFVRFVGKPLVMVIVAIKACRSRVAFWLNCTLAVAQSV